MIKPPDEPIYRENLFTVYVDNLRTYLKLQHPEYSEKDIESFIRQYAREETVKLKKRLNEANRNREELDEPRDNEHRLWPTAQVVRHCHPDDEHKTHSYGNLTLYADEDISKITHEFSNKLISTSGTIYETPNLLQSFLKGMIDDTTANRKKEKKLMLKAKKDGDKIAEVFHNNLQATFKIENNSKYGAFGSLFNFLTDIGNLNAVTSISRYFVMTSYAHAERFLESNFYFRTVEQVINHLINCLRYGPTDEDIVKVINQYEWLYKPTHEDVKKFIIDSLRDYNHSDDVTSIESFIDKLSSERLTFVYYMSNLKHLAIINEEYFRSWFDKFFSIPEYGDLSDIDENDLATLDGDLITLLATVHQELLPRNKNGNSISIFDCITLDPELSKKLFIIGKHMEKMLDDIQPLIDIFNNHNVGIGSLVEHKYMYRDAVALSDTDSIIFTTRSWVEWYTHSNKVTQQAYNINASIVYFLSKATANILAHLSIAFGASKEEVFKMNMKNEFMMPILIVTPLKKHYASTLAVQEGVFFGEHRLDLKGVGLRGSNFSASLTNFVTWFTNILAKEIEDVGHIKITKYMIYAMMLERYILDSLHKYETTFLTIEPVKNERDYKEPEKSIYFNYKLWEEVFAEKYGHIQIPTKCFVLPLLDVSSQSYSFYLNREYPVIFEKLSNFTTQYPKKEITRIPLNPLNNQIPEELVKVTDLRSIIYSNLKPLYLLLNCFGICTGADKNKNQKTLLSDIYGWVNLTNDIREDMNEIFTTGDLKVQRYQLDLGDYFVHVSNPECVSF